jgi:exonuclease SbcD
MIDTIMKILHTADWHLGKKLERYSRLEEQIIVMDEICQIAENEKVDAVLIAGDIFDTFNPSTEALELFYKTVKRLSSNARVPVIAIAGNHDSPDRIEAPDPLAKENGIFLIGYPNTELKEIELDSGLKVSRTDNGFIEFILPNIEKPLRIITSPYANEQRLKTAFNIEKTEQELRDLLKDSWSNISELYCDDGGINILLSHHFFVKEGEKAIENSDDEKPILYIGGAHEIFTNSIPEDINYTALGHLHRFQKVEGGKSPVIYSGSPLAYSFAEASQEKYVAIVSFDENGKADINKKLLQKGKKLLRKKFDNIDNAVAWLSGNQNDLIELTIIADEYLSSLDRQRINQAHNGVISIIPEIKNTRNNNNLVSDIDLQQNMNQLFSQYFKSKFGQEPNESVKSLFDEIQSK